jgi:hypothetical protein
MGGSVSDALNEAIEIAESDNAVGNLEHWKARAIAAERASEHKEHLLTLISQAAKQDGRIVVAVGISCGHKFPAIYIQSNSQDEQEVLGRLLQTVGPWVRLLHVTIRETDARHERKAAEAEEVDDE